MVLSSLSLSRHVTYTQWYPTLERGLAYLLGVQVTCVDKGVHKDAQIAVELWPLQNSAQPRQVTPGLAVVIMGLDGSRDHERSGKPA
jgi:hypothetical protein